VDDRSACPPGLQKQVEKRLGAMGIPCAFPRPFCAFDGGPHELLEAFARSFGRPKFLVRAEGDRVGTVEVLRDAPCGSARFVAGILPGTRLPEAPDAGALRHHHHPCLASMEIDPDLEDTIMHLSGYIVRAALKSAMKGK
jgi:thymidylate synthase